MSQKKRLAIVGCGRIAHAHAKRLTAQNCELVFQSRSEQSARRMAAMFSGARHVAKLDTLLSDASIDGVVISSPPEFHFEHALQCLDAEKPCLIEKPLCVSRDELEKLERELNRHPAATLMVAENYLYKPLLELIRNLLDQGTLGKIRHLRMRKELTQQSQGWKSSYGALFEGGIHFIAFINEIAGQAPQRVKARFPHASAKYPERSSITQLEYANGFSAELSYSWETPSATKGLFQHSRLEGERGSLLFESNGLYAQLQTEGRSRLLLPRLRDVAGYSGMMRDFLNCIGKTSQKPFSDFAKSRRDLLTVFEAYESAGQSHFLQKIENETRIHG